MFHSHNLRSSTALLVALGLTGVAIAPVVSPAPAAAQASFYDVPSNYWAQEFIRELASRDIIKGFPDGSFRPDEPVTRAQFAAMVSKAFNRTTIRQSSSFVDVSSSYWAATAIQEAYTTGFMAGYPGFRFNPEQNIPRVQVLVSLSNGLNYTTSSAIETTLQQYYQDAATIPDYARTSVAAATENRLVVSYPNVRFLNPNQTATRADVAAFIYQALNSVGQANAITSPYIVGQAPTSPPQTQVRIPAGTVIPVRYDKEKILVSKDETAPVTLIVAQNLVTSQGTVLIPAGSQVVGELRPAQGGSQFVAKELVLPNNRRLSMSASSAVVTRTENIDKGINAGSVIQNAAIGAAAAAGIAAVTGDRAIATEEVLGGAGVGTLIGLFLGRDRVTLISINPNTDLNLTLNSDLLVN
ncbi:S-layer protein [Leptolyngbya sp. 'hensonii']|uniref:S-layer homology domain-containing protein n=1 Tax=Leptolyngbya sp. 'hensonii' TaxID=1922337 RepID=UPI0009500407|nr:S-layer homology domain-containing protein [Leptolyngbya sp. 'hensonii']OLP17304.1 S-layer protein [Leptolyngbya sp. 'hensonii']